MKTLEELDLGNWNGKVYGRREYNSCNIYLGKEKVEISNEEADMLEAMNYIPVYKRGIKSINKSVKGDYVKKDAWYEDEFNAALGIVG